MKAFLVQPLALAIHNTIALSILCGCTLTVSTQSIAAVTVEKINYQISAMPLDKALSLFSAQSGIGFSFQPNELKHLKSNGLNGPYTVDDGFNILLKPHNLMIQKTSKGYLIQNSPKKTLFINESNAKQLEKKYLTADKNNLNTVQLSKITVKANVNNNEVISRHKIDRYGITSAADLLRGISGVQMGDSRNGGALDVNIRGIQGQGRVAVTVDGAQQSLDTYRGYGGTQHRSYIDPDLISQISITKGINSASTPVGGIGGTVAMKTLTVDDILLADKTIGLKVTGEFLDNSLEPEYRSHIATKETKLGKEPAKGRGNFLNNSAKAGTIAFASKSEKLDVVAAYAHRKQGNYFAGKHGHERYRIFNENGDEKNSAALSYAAGEEILNSSSETQSFLLKSNIRPKEDHELELSYRNFEGKYGEIMPSDIFRFGTAGIYQYPLGEIKMNTATARYSFNPEMNNLINLKANLWWNQAKSEQLNASFFAPSSQKFMSDRSWVRMDNERMGGDLANTFKFNSNYGIFKLNVGAAFQHEDLSPQKSVYISQHDRNVNKIMRDGYRSEFNMNAQLDYEPTEKLKVWAGLKYSAFNSKDRNSEYHPINETKKLKQIRAFREGEWGGNMYWFPDENGNYTDATDPRLNNGIIFSDSNNPLDGTPYDEYGAVGSQVYDEQELSIVTGFKAKPSVTSKDHAITPSFGLSYEILPNTSLFASYTMGSRMPSLFDTTLGTHQVSPIVGLKPERARVIEVGASTQLDDILIDGDNARLKFAYFDTKIKNFITRYYDTRTFGAMYMTNADSYAVNGFEFSSHYDSSKFFTDVSATYYLATQTCDAAFAEILRSSASEYNLTHNTPNCTSGSYMGSYTNTQNPPKFSANLALGHYFYDKKLTIGGRAIYTSGPTEKIDKPWQTGATTPQIEYKPVTLLDAFMNYKLNKNIDVNASIQNITNRYYLDALSQSFMPSPGRTFKTGITFKF